MKLIAWLSNSVILALFLVGTPLHGQESSTVGKSSALSSHTSPGAASTFIPAPLRATLANMSQEIPPPLWRI